MKYRREIDGLRAVAVLPVIFFHAGFKAFEGGFVGVDVFFVISGYLITSIILADMSKSKFSIVTFYERRARRILPVLFFVMFCCLPFAWLLLPPNHLKDFLESVSAVSVFSSNFLFWSESGYFDTAAELKPLLHTWSLAVEEQFYLLFPLFLMVLWKLRKRWVFGALVAVGTASLVLSQWAAYNMPSANFFLLPTRFWELALGAILGFYFLYKREQSELISSHKIASELFGFIGLLLILYAVFSFDKTTPFPSLYALAPTVGTALIIVFSTSSTLVGRLLSIKPMVGVGLLSYSAYLWHQPIFSFARHKYAEELSVGTLLSFAALSIVLAYFSWRFVEMPFRDKKLVSKKLVFGGAVAATVLFATIGLAGQPGNVLFSIFTQEQLAMMEYAEYYPKMLNENKCFLGEEDKYTDFPSDCYESMNKDSSLIWGDSYAASLSYGLGQEVKDLYQLTASKCPPILNLQNTSNPGCYEMNNFARMIISTKKPTNIFMHANWQMYGNSAEVLQRIMYSTINAIKSTSPKSNIVIVGGIPQWEEDLPSIILDKNIKLDKEVYWEPNGDSLIVNKRLDDYLKSTANSAGAYFVSAKDILCTNGECKAVLSTDKGYKLTTWDYGHLTDEGSALVARRIIENLEAKDKKF